MADLRHVSELVHRHLDGRASDAQSDELQRLLTMDRAAADLFARLTRFDAVLDSHFLEPAGGASDVFGFLKPEPKPSRLRRWLWPAAAVVVLAVSAALYFRSASEPGGPVVIKGRVLVDGIETGRIGDGAPVVIGEESPAVVRLSDGSEAEFDARSVGSIRGRDGDIRQSVEITRGGGRFKVAPAGGRFRVVTPVGTVTALGTEFTVRIRPAKRPDRRRPGSASKPTISVTVIDGAVRVESGGKAYRVSTGPMRLFGDDGKQNNEQEGEHDTDDGDRNNNDNNGNHHGRRNADGPRGRDKHGDDGDRSDK